MTNTPLATRKLEPHADFRLVKLLSKQQHESVTENLGLRGYADLAKYLWDEWTFDRRFGVNTEFCIPPEQLQFDDKGVQKQASRYRATPPYCVRMSLLRLSERLGGFEGHSLIDYGAGAGRVMLLAANAGVPKITGLELSPDLVREAKANLSKFSNAFGGDFEFDVLTADAAEFIPPKDATIFYFFNPFSGELFDKALQNIKKSVEQSPRVIWLLSFQSSRYRYPGLELLGSVTGVSTYSNILDPEAFFKAD